MTDIERLRTHAEDLARAFGVDLLLRAWIPPDIAYAVQHPDGVHKAVIARTITDETSYAVVLHELGHSLAPLGHIRFDLRLIEAKTDTMRWWRLKLEEEYAAWEWARHHALYWSVAMQMVEQQTLGTYGGKL